MFGSDRMTSVLYDTHAHLDFPDFAADLPGILERAQAAGVEKIISIATSLESSRRVIELAARHPMIYAAVGVHPCNVRKSPDEIVEVLRELARAPKVVAIGETGLDYFHPPSKQGGTFEDDQRDRERQALLFEQHLSVAKELDLNVVIHQRNSFVETVAQLQPWRGRLKFVFHCFGGTTAEAETVLSMGGFVSFTGILTFKNAGSLRDVMARIPQERMFFETDCPYLAPVPHRGKRCEPAHVRETALVAAKSRACELEELAESTSAAARGFFRGLSI